LDSTPCECDELSDFKILKEHLVPLWGGGRLFLSVRTTALHDHLLRL
jgi:hypothetical protein